MSLVTSCGYSFALAGHIGLSALDGGYLIFLFLKRIWKARVIGHIVGEITLSKKQNASSAHLTNEEDVTNCNLEIVELHYLMSCCGLT